MTASLLAPGDKAPSFTADAVGIGAVSLSRFAGKTLVLYFYPKDNTPGCTKEACALRDINDQLMAAGAAVIGVSKDSAASHQKFTADHGLNFPLIADPQRAIIDAYGVWQEKIRCGKTSQGVVRSTFIIDSQGVIRHAWYDVKVDGHDQRVLKAVKELAVT